ncbi:hypothetical protein PLICRDRAFT_496148 [Plicaturopsis crispa FD-325 SS-3]|nr:hypothetical protein PLICRDRAFT_496148 [Plicaturopsis crispa FD-325 SS-3]
MFPQPQPSVPIEGIDTLPPYVNPNFDEESTASPTYSPHPVCSERVLHSLPSSHLHRVGSGSADPDFVFRTEHMEVNLGPRAFSTHKPAFGWRGIVLGHAKFSGYEKNVVRVTVALKGEITTTVTARGTVASSSRRRLLSQTITLYSQSSESSEWGGDHTFAIPFSAEETMELPPSYDAIVPATTCDVSYSLRVEMTRKGLRRHETINIPILYLPKSRPSHPPLLAMPPLPALASAHIPPFPIDSRIKTVEISALWPTSSQPTDTSAVLHLSLPSPACFTSGDPIPLLVSLVTQGDATLAGVLMPTLRVTLLKRTRVWCPGERTVLRSRDVPIASVDTWTSQESADGCVSRIKCKLQAGCVGHESSWGVEGTIDIQYFIRVVLGPLGSVADNVPSFRHEEPVKITTDPFGLHERELLSTGGVPTPAIGLARCELRRRSDFPMASDTNLSSFTYLSVYR